MKESDVTTVISVLNRVDVDNVDKKINIGRCPSGYGEDLWFIYFTISSKGYDKILKELLKEGALGTFTLSPEKEHIYFETLEA
ncbi:hypothetical protein [Enterococcus cecorum]|nr:hypothetical protein [Enterococcus cecorum]